MKSLNKIAEQLVAKNGELEGIVRDNPDNSYKLLEQIVTGSLVTKIGRKEGLYIKRNLLIWAIIDACSDESEDLDY